MSVWIFLFGSLGPMSLPQREPPDLSLGPPRAVPPNSHAARDADTGAATPRHRHPAPPTHTRRSGARRKRRGPRARQGPPPDSSQTRDLRRPRAAPGFASTSTHTCAAGLAYSLILSSQSRQPCRVRAQRPPPSRPEGRRPPRVASARETPTRRACECPARGRPACAAPSHRGVELVAVLGRERRPLAPRRHPSHMREEDFRVAHVADPEVASLIWFVVPPPSPVLRRPWPSVVAWAPRRGAASGCARVARPAPLLARLAAARCESRAW